MKPHRRLLRPGFRPRRPRRPLGGVDEVMRRQLVVVRLLEERVAVDGSDRLEGVGRQLAELDRGLAAAINAVATDERRRAVEALESALAATDGLRGALARLLRTGRPGAATA